MKKLALLLVLAFITFSSKAQIVYQDNVLTFNGTRHSEFMTTWNGWAHAWKHGTKVLKLDMSPADPRIATSTDKIVFLDTERLFYNDIYARNYYNYSDVAAKRNITNFSNATSVVMALRPVTYQWQDQTEYQKFKRTSSNVTNPKEIGFIAQEVEQVLPDVIGIDDLGNKLVNYTAIIPVLTAAIQELNAKVEALEAKIAELQK